MMRKPIFFLAAAGLAACSPSADNAAANQAAAAPKKEKTPYCFFKDDETKGWSASTDKDGNVVVRGKVYRQDARYKAVLDKPKVEGATAEVWPSVATNDTGYGATDNWWDVKLTIPGSATVGHVSVRCGAKTFASLDVPRKN
jgi:hypothetical protein